MFIDLIGQKPMVYYTGKSIEKGIQTTKPYTKPAIDLQTTILERLKNRTIILYTQPFLILKSTGFHILLLSVKICYCHSFKSYEVQSWKAIYISWQCQITEKDNTCVNFWCIKFLGKLNHVPTLNKTDNFSILELFYVKNKFLNERNCL